MTVRLKTLAGLALALAMFGGQSAAKADATSAVRESRDEGWRALRPVDWAIGEWEDAIDRFGDLVELLPQPAELVCETVGRINPVVRLQCAYWDWVNDHVGDHGRDGDERGARGDDDHDADGRDARSSDGRGGKRQSDDDRGGKRQADDDAASDEAGI